MAFYFFKLALSKHLTRGRKSSHVIAACVYITCRTEGTSHMLIDFSDVLQIDVYELGRTYLRLSQALCINIPAMDPCLYVMRFAHRLEFGDKTHDVSMTALRLVSRMKKDWIHFGRRPSGLCGAALLIAARLHEFSRSINDVIKVVKVHESTLRKRLSEFGETPASQLTLDEFMTVDLDAMTEEQDPPSFKAARRKDRERLAEIDQDENLEQEMTKLESLIEKELEERKGKMKGPYAKYAKSASPDDGSNSPMASTDSQSEPESESEDAVMAKFLKEQSMEILGTVMDNKEASAATSKAKLDSLLMPPPTSTPVRNTLPSPSRSSVTSPGMGLRNTVEDYLTNSPKDAQKDQEEESEEEKDEELDLTGIDDDEIDSYIMSPQEIRLKTKLWLKMNADYLLEQEEKLKKEKLEREELIKQGKDPDKKRRLKRKSTKMSHTNNSSAIEAIEKIVQEKKISTKINYDVLKSLNMSPTPSGGAGSDSKSTNESESEGGDDTTNCDTTNTRQPNGPASKRIKAEIAAADSASKLAAVNKGRAIPTIRPRTAARPNLNNSVKSEESSGGPRKNVNFSAFISNKRKPAVTATNNKETTVISEPGTSDKNPDNISQDSGIGSQLSERDSVSQERDSVSQERRDTTAGSQDLQPGEQSKANPQPIVESGNTTAASDNLDDSFEETDDGEMSVAELFNRHTGQSTASYSDMEEDYY
eukprot:TRINITY_DN11429_c0_g1_i6.p1 TRINITY_DN11429_c0_g1~~TRINITY_DN11429_c0_g1_i6.p1  ORF type:complete len:706 (+),score=171.72 TRINITY_DN11429_c0_g1_i6:368-2485(+)